jgi:hypothetical protein
MVAWSARVSPGGLTAVTGNVYFQVNFNRAAKEGEAGAVPVPVTVVKPLAVTSQAPLPLAEVVEARTETTIESVNNKRPGFLYLTLKSKTNVPVTSESITLKYPAWMGVYLWESEKSEETPQNKIATNRTILHKLSLAPFESRTIGFQVTANPEVKPGKQLVVFEVPLEWEKGGRRQKAMAVATQQVDVGVFGETAILAAIGIPTFLFLPGFLMLTTIALLWKAGKPKAEKENFPFKANTPDFYLIAITISMAAFAAYPWLTKHFTKVRRDFTEAYGLQDVVWVWFGSIIAGLLGYGLWRLIAFGFDLCNRWYRNRYCFALADDEEVFVKKLKRRGLGVRFRPLTTGAYFIEDDPLEEGKSWVAPKLGMLWISGTPDEQAVTGPMNDPAASGSEVLSDLISALKKKTVSLAWRGSGAITALQKVESSAATKSGQPTVIFQNV